jgi:succinate dehydrogenase/fumarate reductase flavoprotein subunit
MVGEHAPPHLDLATTPARCDPGGEGIGGEDSGGIGDGCEGEEVALRLETQQLMWSNVGIVRDARRLSEAVARLTAIVAALPPPRNHQRAEARNIAQSGLAIARSALARTESRGGHFRSDFPARDDVNFRKHSVMVGDRVHFELNPQS